MTKRFYPSKHAPPHLPFLPSSTPPHPILIIGRLFLSLLLAFEKNRVPLNLVTDREGGGCLHLLLLYHPLPGMVFSIETPHWGGGANEACN